MRAMVATVILLLMALATARGDVIHLVDGSQVEGRIQKTSDGWAVTQKDGSVVTVAADKVASIEATPSNSVSVEQDRLDSLRRVAQNLSDLQDIINRYQQFISLTTDPDVAAAAKKDLQVWQQRLDESLVKLGEQWITPQERDRRRALAQSEALPAQDLIANYHYKQAEPLLKQAILDDPQCATALYLLGVMRYKQDQVSDARKAFEAVNTVVEYHGPTLNNLAVIAWREKSFVVAMNYYDQAMMASPQAKEILDNVAEALNALPDANKQAPVALHAVRLFAEQDALLQKAAAEHGMYRWGATWVNAKELDELKADEARVKQKLDDLQRQFDMLQWKINQIDNEISENKRAMDRLQANNTQYDANGNVITFLPDMYFQLKRDNETLERSKQPVLQQQALLARRADEARQELPVPKFTGLQQIIGVDGTPLRELTTTAPTTDPSQAN